MESTHYGDRLNNEATLGTTQKFIMNKLEKRLTTHAQSLTMDEFLAADDRVHCVFLVLAPHRLRDLDVEFIARIAPYAQIVPVVAKADAMTHKERKAYLDQLKSTFAVLAKQVGEPVVHDFLDDELRASNSDFQIAASAAMNVFAMVCGSIVSEESSVCQESVMLLGREYPWGLVQQSDTSLSDLTLLQSLLFHTGVYSHINPKCANHALFIIIE
jgi:septin family protein